MPTFVALRVAVRPGESNRAALNRTLKDCSIRFPAYIPTPGGAWGTRFLTREQIPATDTRQGGDWLVKYEKEN